MERKEEIVVFGGSGLLGSRFCALNERYFKIISPSHSQINILNYDKLNQFLKATSAKVVINFVGLANVNQSEQQKGNLKGQAYLLNALGVKKLAKICKKLGKHLVHLSTDCVFDGRKIVSPYTEKDKPNPINWYGQTKYLGELFLKESGCSYTLVRVEMAYTACLDFKGQGDFVRFFLQRLGAGQEILAITDQKITPTFIDAVAKALRLLVKNRAPGIFHVASTDWISPYDFAVTLANQFHLDQKLIKPVTFGSLKNRAPRPKHPWLDATKFQRIFGEGILHSNYQSIKLFKKQLNLKRVSGKLND